MFLILQTFDKPLILQAVSESHGRSDLFQLVTGAHVPRDALRRHWAQISDRVDCQLLLKAVLISAIGPKVHVLSADHIIDPLRLLEALPIVVGLSHWLNCHL